MFVENPGEINRFVLGRWRNYLAGTAKSFHPVLGPWHAFAAIPEAQFAEKAAELARTIAVNSAPTHRANPLVARAFEGESPATLGEVGDRYARLFKEVEEAWQKLIAEPASSGAAAPTALPDPAQEEIRQVLYADGTPTAVTPRDADDAFEKPAADKLRAVRKKVHEWRTSASAPPNAMALVDNPRPFNPVVFMRGNPGNRGPAVPRQFLGVLAGERREPFKNGSGRLELARAIASRDNPLTARVMVNRVWLHLFGAGLVRTPSDFGVRSEPPSHPELLDYLAARFMDDGWSVKKLIRHVMLSSVYQQGSDGVESGARNAESKSVAPHSTLHTPHSPDPDNRLLWRQNRRRLDFESMRDSLLAVAGDLDLTPGGVSIDLTKQPFSRRRTVYGFVERQNLPGMLRTFDFASPDHHCPQRFTTTVPQQALFLMNSPFVVEQARRLASRADVRAQANSELRLQRLYWHTLGRSANDEELELGLSFVRRAAENVASTTGATQVIDSWEQVAQVLLLSNEFLFVD